MEIGKSYRPKIPPAETIESRANRTIKKHRLQGGYNDATVVEIRGLTRKCTKLYKFFKLYFLSFVSAQILYLFAYFFTPFRTISIFISNIYLSCLYFGGFVAFQNLHIFTIHLFFQKLGLALILSFFVVKSKSLLT